MSSNQEEKKRKEKTVAFLKELKARGILVDEKIKDENIREAKRKQRVTAYHNTLSLLKQYRTIVWLLECFPDTIAQELDLPLGDIDKIIEKLDVEISYGNRKLENRLISVEKTRLMLDRVNEALSVLKRKPNDGERMYELIYLTYIGPETLNHFDLLYRLNLSSRQYYRIKEQAVKILSMRLWSADESDVGFWIEIMSIIEQMG